MLLLDYSTWPCLGPALLCIAITLFQAPQAQDGRRMRITALFDSVREETDCDITFGGSVTNYGLLLVAARGERGEGRKEGGGRTTRRRGHALIASPSMSH